MTPPPPPTTTPPPTSCCAPPAAVVLLLLLVVLATGQLGHQLEANASLKLFEAHKPSKPASWRDMELALAQQISTFSATSVKGQLEAALAKHHFQASPLISQNCSTALNEALDGLISDDPKRAQKVWAAAMLDASAKLPAAGLLSGNLAELGNFDQCLSLANGQYCNVLLKPPLDHRRLPLCRALQLTPTATPGRQVRPADESLWLDVAKRQQMFHYAGIRLGLCLPKRCNQDELQRLLKTLLEQFGLNGKIKSCQRRLGQQPDTDPARPISDNSDEYYLLGLKLDLVQLSTLVAMLTLVVQCALCTLISQVRTTTTDGSERAERKLAGSSSASCESASDASSAATIDDTRRLARSQPKRWHYEVYQQVGCARQPSAELFAHFHRMSLQRNPLVARARADSELDLEAEESWLEHLEAPEAELDPSQGATGTELTSKTYYCRPCLPPASLLACFSLQTNMSALFGLDARSRFPILNGIRTLSMVWIIFGHTFGLLNLDMLSNSFELAERACSSRTLQALLNATLAVDTFFLLSGLLAVASFLRRCPEARLHLFGVATKKRQAGAKLSTTSITTTTTSDSSASSSAGSDWSATKPKKQPKSAGAAAILPASFKPLTWMLARYGRLTPAYLFTIGLAVLMPALGSGPFWPETAGQVDASCRSSWWLNLLYVNNFVQSDRACLVHSWYLSNDFQFSLLALLLFSLLFASKKLAFILLISLFAASSATTFAVTSVNQFPPTIVATAPATAERWLYIHALYYKPWPHLPAYLIGMLAGCLLELKPQIGAGWRLLGWLLSSLVALSLVHSIYPWNLGLEVEPILAAVHASTFRSLWACCVAWLVFGLTISSTKIASTTTTSSNNKTRPNWLAKLLAWRGFEVSARLTYCAYLLHPLVINYNSGQTRERLDSSEYGCLMRFLSQLVVTYMLSACLALLVELPSSQLVRLLLLPCQPCHQPARKADMQQVCGRRHRKMLDQTLQSVPSVASSSSIGCARIDNNAQLAATGGISVASPGHSEAARDQTEPADKTVAGSGDSSNETMHSIELRSCLSPKSQLRQHQARLTHFEPAKVDLMRPPQVQQAPPLDSEFQKRLAQAISRGFRLRSRMAAESGSIRTASNHQQAATVSSPAIAVCSPKQTATKSLHRQASSCSHYGASRQTSRPQLSTFASGHQLPDDDHRLD